MARPRSPKYCSSPTNKISDNLFEMPEEISHVIAINYAAKGNNIGLPGSRVFPAISIGIKTT